ncbi:MAG TPA: phosphoserine phosphatase [Candidatus Thermoplasmatota archaeon]|nr:phosphoserine phosphatase [Candidatus Thermoplasmatota archaeon]
MAETAIPEDVEKRKEALNAKAHRLRADRDRQNDETKRHAARRDELNGKVRGLIDQANKHKAERDRLNQAVRDAKVKRDELNKAANEKAEALNALKKERGGAATAAGPTPQKLRQELKRLEFEQQTKALEPKKEKALIERIAALNREIAERERAEGGDAALAAAVEAMREAKAAAEAQHKHVTELAVAAQGEHDAMVRLFAEADGYRKEADAAQAEFIKSKGEADRIHQEYIAAVTEIRSLDRSESAERPRRDRAPAAAAEPAVVPSEVKAEAEVIFGKFKKGEKLSTEDLMTLQKAGLL